MKYFVPYFWVLVVTPYGTILNQILSWLFKIWFFFLSGIFVYLSVFRRSPKWALDVFRYKYCSSPLIDFKWQKLISWTQRHHHSTLLLSEGWGGGLVACTCESVFAAKILKWNKHINYLNSKSSYYYFFSQKHAKLFENTYVPNYSPAGWKYIERNG